MMRPTPCHTHFHLSCRNCIELVMYERDVMLHTTSDCQTGCAICHETQQLAGLSEEAMTLITTN